MGQSSISVALVEDDPGTRARLEAALQLDTRIQLRFSCSTFGEMHDWLSTHLTDVLLVDLGLPDGSGIDLVRYCAQRSPHTEVMVVTLFGDETNMIHAFEAGARGYLLKDGIEDDLSEHVHSLHAGGSPMSPIIARQLLARWSRNNTTEANTAIAPVTRSRFTEDSTLQPRIQEALTQRESEILNALAKGYTYAELAKLLGITHSTIASHVKNIYGKLAVHNRSGALFEARQMGLLRD
jgi:DNA-binding NarL/FixJ family response regulator